MSRNEIKAGERRREEKEPFSSTHADIGEPTHL